VPPRVLAARLVGVVAATLVMAGACVAARDALSELGVGMAARAGLTIALGFAVYAIALRFLAPDVVGRATTLARRAIGTRRRRQPA
jgi:hypothetical protein